MSLRPFVLSSWLWLLWPGAVLAQSPAAPVPEGELKELLALQGDAARGKTLFARCEFCHRKEGAGRVNGWTPRLAGQHASVLLKQVADIRSGRRANPEMQPLVLPAVLPLAQIADVVAYLKALPVSADNGKGPGSQLERGRQLYAKDCVACHGAKGEGDAARFVPAVAAQHYEYLLREVINIRDGTRGNSNPEMVQVVKAFGQADIEALADHMSRLLPAK